MTTGGFTAVYIWFEREEEEVEVKIESNHFNLNVKLSDIGIDAIVVDCDGMDKSLQIQTLPEAMGKTTQSLKQNIQVPASGDGAIYMRVILEDGHVGWTSPIYVFQRHGDRADRRPHQLAAAQ